jgi:hypothetical protein
MTEEQELRQYAEIAAWKRFKQEVEILKGYGFKQEQLQKHINIVYKM